MSIKPDFWIQQMCASHRMIEPFVDRQVRMNVVSYGLSSYGYDFRVSDRFKEIVADSGTVIDPKKIATGHVRDITVKDWYVLEGRSFVLARSLEYFRIPRNVLTVCFGKSTYARNGLVVNITPFEPEWEGFVTMALCNTAPQPIKIYANEGIAQVLFFESDAICKTSYADKKGKYQKQKTIQVSSV
ncbi:MAG: dCTP deaminase [Elusimicrobia bacterium]|nr:dCTP deaminase [Elusimicrobiota bacterium]MBD3411873.1 dCTP deaminase [Elusimicrobiota bacterium]